MKMRMKHLPENDRRKSISHTNKAQLFIDLANLDEANGMAVLSNQRMLSSDIVRTKQFDSSSRQLNPSLLRGTVAMPSTYKEIDRDDYCAPCDRVARFYTQSAAGLTLKLAAKVAKHMNTTQKQPKKIIGFSLSATAPDAFKATQRIAEIAETGIMPVKQKKINTTVFLPSSSSPLAKREEHRLIRSDPMYTTIKPSVQSPQTDSPPSFNNTNHTNHSNFNSNFNVNNNSNNINDMNMNGSGNGLSSEGNYDSWDPDSLEEGNGERNNKGHSYVSPLMKLEQKAQATERYTYICVCAYVYG